MKLQACIAKMLFIIHSRFVLHSMGPVSLGSRTLEYHRAPIHNGGQLATFDRRIKTEIVEGTARSSF